MKAILLDADGVVLNKGENFSDRFAREHNVPIEEVMEFFDGPFSACQSGDKDLKEELVPYLEKWGWKKSADDFLDYWFKDMEIDPEIEDFIERCHEKGINCYLASNNETQRARRIERMLGNKLDGYFFSADLGVKKENKVFFESVLDKLGLDPEEVTLIDNERKNVESALELGIDARKYRKEYLDELLKGDDLSEFKSFN